MKLFEYPEQKIILVAGFIVASPFLLGFFIVLYNLVLKAVEK